MEKAVRSSIALGSRLEGQPQGKLHDAGVACQRSYLSSRATTEIVARLAKLRCVGQIEYFPAKLESDRLMNGEIAHQREVENVSVRPTKCVASHIPKEAGALQLEGVRQARLQCGAKVIFDNKVPAVHVAHDRGRSDLIRCCRHGAKCVKAAGNGATGTDGEGPSAGEGVDAGRLEASDDVGKNPAF
jgi:hypothetical protein